MGTIAGNAFDATRTPGGSSAGSGAAVGDWQCQLAFGTQTVNIVFEAEIQADNTGRKYYQTSQL